MLAVPIHPVLAQLEACQERLKVLQGKFVGKCVWSDPCIDMCDLSTYLSFRAETKHERHLDSTSATYDCGCQYADDCQQLVSDLLSRADGAKHEHDYAAAKNCYIEAVDILMDLVGVPNTPLQKDTFDSSSELSISMSLQNCLLHHSTTKLKN